MRPSSRRLLAVFTVLGLMAAACGGGDDEAATPGGAVAGGQTCADIDLSKPPAAPVNVRIGHGVASEEPFWLMKADPSSTKHQGTWYSLEYSQFRASEERLVAYQAGKLDAALVPPQVVIRGIAQGLNVVPMATVMREGENDFNTTFLALESSGIKEQKDLKGKTLAIIDLGSHLDYVAKAAVEEGGANFRTDAKYVVLPFPAQEQALRGGQVDVIGLAEPFYSAAKAKGGVVDLFDAVDVTGFPFDLLTVVFDKKFVEQNPGVVCAWVTDYQAAMAKYKSDKETARTAIHKAGFVQVPLPVYVKTQDYERPDKGVVDVAAYEQFNDKLIEFGILQQPQKVDAEKLSLPGFTAGTEGAPDGSAT